MDLERKYNVYINEQTDNVSLHESCIKKVIFNSFETVFYVDWSQGYGDFLIRCLYPELVEYNFSTINEYLPRNTVLNYLEITEFSYLKEENGYTIQINFDTGCMISKLLIGPTGPNPGPILPRVVMLPVTPIIVEFSNIAIIIKSLY